MPTELKTENGTLYSGGTYPKIGELLQESLDEFVKHIGPYALAGVGQLLVSIPILLISIVLLYILIIAGVFGSAIAGGGIAMILPSELAPIGVLIGLLIGVCVIVGTILLFLTTLTTIMAPFNASLMRAVAAHQRGDAELTLGAVFSTATTSLISVIGGGLLLGLLTMILLSFCYIPVLLVPLLFGFATALIALYGEGAIGGLKAAFSHAKGNLKWHAIYMLCHMGIMLLANNIPVVGPMFVIALHVRATRIVFGDGPHPVLKTELSP